MKHQDLVLSVAFSPIKIDKAKKERLEFLKKKLGKGKIEKLFYFGTTKSGDVKPGHIEKQLPLF